MGPGHVVVGRYRIVERIGRGGHGEVWRAQQLPLGRDVALKVLLPEAYSGDSPGRFAREASLVQALDHPNTVRLFDFGVDESGLPFMAFELLRGRTLEQEIEKGPLSPERVARIASQVLKALMDAHARGIIHRDVKPSNVFLVDFAGEKDFVKVLDFGVARHAVENTTQPKLTSDGQMVGTPAYMAPEQVKDETIGPATDIYSLGLVIAEALSATMVVAGTTQAQIWMMQASAAPIVLPPRVITSALGPVVARAVNKDPGRRFASAEEMLDAIDKAMSVGSTATDPLAAPIARPTTTTPTPLPPPVPMPAPSPRAFAQTMPTSNPPPPAAHPTGRPPMGSMGSVRTRPSAPSLPSAPSADSSQWARWAIGLVVAAGLASLVITAMVMLRGTRPRVVINSPSAPNAPNAPNDTARVDPSAPPMLPVEAEMTRDGWKSILAKPLVQTTPLFQVTSFAFNRQHGAQRTLHVSVYDFYEEGFAIDEERRRRESEPEYAVRRRKNRLVVVDADRRPVEARAIAAQLLP